MDIKRYGIILQVHLFEECVNFYKSVFQLQEIFSKVDGEFRLTCLEFGSSYLMIETGGVAYVEGKNVVQNPVKLRFNVSDIQQACEKLNARGVEAAVIETEWGSIINIYDPDGNPISIRDDSGFQNQTAQA